VIRNGADPLPVDEATPSTTLGDPLVLSIGRLERYKGHHRVIAAMPPLLARAPGARLVVVGSGPYEHRLRRQVASAGLAGAVTFSAFGSSERAKLGALLTKADVVTLMSDYEAHPVAVMEALALGTPVLTAQGSGLTELGRSGLVRTVPARSAPAELAVAVLAVARGGRAVPRPDLPTWDECTDGLARVYHAVAQ
jgi:glycosyltransferase involved in cell wall biosynthesis